MMANGVVTGEVAGDGITEDSIMKYAVAGHGESTANKEALS